MNKMIKNIKMILYMINAAFWALVILGVMFLLGIPFIAKILDYFDF